jgi:hypothetical protein
MLKKRSCGNAAFTLSLEERRHREGFGETADPFVVSLSNHEHFTLRQAQGERLHIDFKKS